METLINLYPVLLPLISQQTYRNNTYPQIRKQTEVASLILSSPLAPVFRLLVQGATPKSDTHL